MQTRRDQLQAYRYVIRRILSSLLGTEPEHPEQPMRRIIAATMSGLMVFFVAGGIVALVTWLSKSGAQAWKQDGAYIIEKETGARYVMIEGELAPVENYTSARLIVGPDITPVRASRKDLAEAPIGPRRGIVGAPDSLPDAEHVTSSPWTTCVRQEGTGKEAETKVDVYVGEDVAEFGAEEVGDRAVVVAEPDNGLFLIWNGLRYQTDEDSLSRLGLGSPDPIPVKANWLNAVPAGPPLIAMTVPNRGTDADYSVGGQSVSIGDVIATDVNTYYVVHQSGLEEIKETEYLLLRGARAELGLTVWDDMTAADVTAEDVPTVAEDDELSAADLPDSPPELASLRDGTATPVCAWFEGGDRGEATMTLGGNLPEPRNAEVASAASRVSISPATADRVSVPAGEIAIVSELPGPKVAASGYFLVTDAGVRYPVPTEDVLATLGFGEADPVAVPGNVLELVPLGPSLNPEDANSGAPLPNLPQLPDMPDLPNLPNGF